MEVRAVTYTQLEVPGATSTEASGIDGNNVVGWFEDADGDEHGFLYDGTDYTTLEPEGAISSGARAIDGNNVVGWFEDANGDRHGFLYSDTIPIPGDMTGDGFVGADDLAVLINHWNTFVEAGDVGSGDLTGDGYVGADDLSWLIDAWNTGTLPAAATAVPEPASMLMLALGSALLLARRR